MPIHIAIVEDEEMACATLKNFLQRYGQEYALQFEIDVFSNAISFLNGYSANYDMVFMDIRMPYINGMDAAQRLRMLDKKVLLIFVTSLVQYAVEGYEVEAFDYIVKPIGYYDFSLKITRAMKKIARTKAASLVLTTDAGSVRLEPADILYVETQGHHLHYHTKNGEYTQYGSLSKLEERLSGQGFARCNSCYLVNLQYVRNVKGYQLTLGAYTLKISQPRKKEFMQALNIYRSHAAPASRQL